MKAIMTQAARPYIRMNGAGNAFIVVQAFEEGFHPTEDQVRALASPEAGLGGFDQLIGIEPSETADAFMRVWNADGSMVQTCGNALRCVGWLLLEATDKEEVVIDTLGGPTTARRAGDHQVTVDMGAPRLDWSQVPLAEVADYGSTLKAITQGEGSYSMELSHYDPVPSNIAQQVAAKARAGNDESGKTSARTSARS